MHRLTRKAAAGEPGDAKVADTRFDCDIELNHGMVAIIGLSDGLGGERLPAVDLSQVENARGIRGHFL
jgi:hypothetical protein